MKPGLSFPSYVVVVTLTAAVFGSRPASPETVVPGDALAVRSSGWSEEGAWVLRGNGYAGSYVRKHASGPLTVRGVVASSSDAATLTVAVADTRSTFAVAETPSFRASFDLPTGTYLIRIERADAAVNEDELLRLSEVRIDGGDVVNAIDDALALEAADTYIEHFRQGPISFSMPEGLAGREARVMLRHRGFRFGANLPGVENVYLHEDAPAGSEADRFQRTFLERFGVTVPSNAGKWHYNEPQPGVVTMDYPDKILDFAHRHGLNARMHALIWDTDQQPDWVHALLAQAKAGDQDAKTALRQAISRRIAYYVAERSMRYTQLDVLNESLHQPGYLDVFGIEGIADIYGETAAAATRAGNEELRLFVNEYNVLQWSRRPTYATEDTPWDPYANWYREHVEALRHHGGPVSGIGVQYYADADPAAAQPHSPTTIAHALHNLALTGLPIALTEFGVSRGATPSDAAEVLTDTMRLMFGHPQGDLFLMFGYYRGATWERAAEACLFDLQWNLTEPGKAFDALLEQWDTELITRVDDDGILRFHGFYGDYDVIVDGQTLRFTAEKPDASAAR